MKRMVWMVCCFLFVGFTGVEAAVIYLKSGREIHTDSYYKESGMIYYTVAGQSVGVPESTVERVDESINDSVVDERIITIRMPRYYKVASTLPGVDSGLYEEAFLDEPCPVFQKIFGTGVLYARGCKTGFGIWILGEASSSSRQVETLATLKHVPKGHGPHYHGAHWTASNGRVCDVLIQSSQAPATTDEEKLVLKFNGFPNGFFNGIYKPWAIVNGRIAYKMKKARDEATLELRSGGNGKTFYYWAISFGKDTYYHSAPFDTPDKFYPHEVTAWSQKGMAKALPGVVGDVSTEKKHSFEFQF